MAATMFAACLENLLLFHQILIMQRLARKRNDRQRKLQQKVVSSQEKTKKKENPCFSHSIKKKLCLLFSYVYVARKKLHREINMETQQN